MTHQDHTAALRIVTEAIEATFEQRPGYLTLIANAIRVLPELSHPQQPAGWQPIETAPQDGTEIILGSLPQTYMGNPVAARVTVGHWSTEEECLKRVGDCGGECRCPEYDYEDPCWLSWDGGFTAGNPPTHWMPLPPPPTAHPSQQEDDEPEEAKCPGCGKRGVPNGKDGEYRCGSGYQGGCTR